MADNDELGKAIGGGYLADRIVSFVSRLPDNLLGLWLRYAVLLVLGDGEKREPGVD